MNDAGLRIHPAGGLTGELAVPGDKSVSHRAVLLGAISSGAVHVRGFGASADTLSTVAAVETLGVEVEQTSETDLLVHGAGLRGLTAPDGPIDVGNAGTLIRLLPGILAGQVGTFELTGDASIRSRPMERIAEPLRRMGVDVETTDGRPPIRVGGTGRTEPIAYELPVASAQVKSCVLLAGLFAGRGVTEVVEPIPTRDHTERMLRAAGVAVDRGAGRVAVSPAQELRLGEIDVPGDFSSAAPFIVAATALSGSNLTLRDVGVNPTRTGLLTVMERMGARVGVFRRRLASGEPVADIEVRPAELVAADIEPELVPLLVDELPLVALLACFAHGVTTIRGASELRVKESDRIAATASALNAVGGHVEPLEDGFRIRGVPTRLRGGHVDAAGDHRVAMLGAVAGVCSQEGVEVRGADVLGVSFPDFADRLAAVSA
ncbi:MAG TPA: 3-phosphoshikimate 1-carboxyvinyltransferase [Gaiellales bacterium]